MRSYLRTVKTAIGALRRNAMRSGLTCLGIIIGITAVIATMEIGNGSQAVLQQTVQDFGANNLIVLPGAAASGGTMFGAGTSMTLTPQDCDAIAEDCPAILRVAPLVSARVQVIYGAKNWVPQNIVGTTPAYLLEQNWGNMQEGECFDDSDVRNARPVCVIGQTLVTQLFDGANPLGKQIRMNNVPFTVIGVLPKKGANMFGVDQDDILIAPWTAIKNRVSGEMLTNVNQSAETSASSTSVNTLSQVYPGQVGLYDTPSDIQAADTPQPVRFGNVNMILAQARSTDVVPEAMAQITGVLHQRHHIAPGEPDDFSVRDPTQILQVFGVVAQVMTKLLLGVAAISLAVGGVGIMNIMLVSVTERTREIGLRMAVGARGRDILGQFLIEAVLLCLMGGAMGIFFGLGSSLLLRQFAHFPTEASLPVIITAVLVSAGVGVTFGFYPALKASKMDPIEALRYE